MERHQGLHVPLLPSTTQAELLQRESHRWLQRGFSNWAAMRTHTWLATPSSGHLELAGPGIFPCMFKALHS
jgi:hypothetical protein